VAFGGIDNAMALPRNEWLAVRNAPDITTAIRTTSIID
jgi:hypothetical protein